MAKKRRKSARKKRTAKRAPRRARRAAPKRRATGASHALGSLKAYLDTLFAQRADLDEKIKAVEKAVHIVGGTPVQRAAGARRAASRGKGTGPRAGSLKDYILNVLGHGGVMSVKDVTAGVRRAGYKTQNKTLAKSVGIALADMPQIRKVRRGRFRLK